MSAGFQRALDHIRSIAGSEFEKGHLFERLMKAYLIQDPLYLDRFADVWLWAEWAERQPVFAGGDTGIDLVAVERAGGYCAIQCKCYAPGTRISKAHLDSFIAASAREPFTARIVIDTGDEWGPTAAKTIAPLTPACAVLRFGDLASRPIDWPDLVREAPEALSIQREPFSLRPHQQAAFDDVTGGFEAQDRGKLIMACGTGKTFTALRIAEAVAGVRGRALYLVPSISLFQQSMREWAEQRAIPHRYIGICSDRRAGHNDEDASFQELEIPVTTDTSAISQALRDAPPDALTVVFCTYHSLGLVEQAQDEGAPPFDIVLCDEAHRTTGIERPGDSTSPLVLVHDAQRIRAAKRLYMTATPRLYTEGARAKAAIHDIDVFSMDDPATYGPELHRLPFSRAVEQDLLSDYKVVVLAMSEQHVDAALQAHLTSSGGEINLTDAAKIVGCWRALQNPENKPTGAGPISSLRRAIAFTNTIKASERLVAHWDGIVTHAVGKLPATEQPDAFRCETRHVDGQHHALERKARIEWLKGQAEGTCRILSNARCLSEGIDVPALDAVLFMSPRNSQVDIVQAVGRAMRKAPGKVYGYIVLPVALPAGVDPAAALDDNERFAVVWSVLRALRSHDDRFDAEINQIDLNNTPTDRIIFSGDGTDGDNIPGVPALPFPPLDLPPGAIFAKIVEKCGDRKYWETWALDVADIFARLVHRIEGLLDNPDNDALREWFEAFHEELTVSINAKWPVGAEHLGPANLFQCCAGLAVRLYDRLAVVQVGIRCPAPTHRGLASTLDRQARFNGAWVAHVQISPTLTPGLGPVGPPLVLARQQQLKRFGETRLPGTVPANHQGQSRPRRHLERGLVADAAKAGDRNGTEEDARWITCCRCRRGERRCGVLFVEHRLDGGFALAGRHDQLGPRFVHRGVAVEPVVDKPQQGVVHVCAELRTSSRRNASGGLFLRFHRTTLPSADHRGKKTNEWLLQLGPLIPTEA